MKRIAIATIGLLIILLSGCSKPEQFTLSGELTNLRDRGVNAIYYDGSSIQSQPLRLAEGARYKMQGYAPRPVLVTLMLTDGTVAGNIIIKNGYNVKLKTDADAPWLGEVTGSKTTAALYAFMAEHGADDTEAHNQAIADYVGAHPGGTESTVLVTNFFHTPDNEVRADSLLRSIKAEARPQTLNAGYQQLLGQQLSADASTQLSSMTFIDKDGKPIRLTPSFYSYSLLAFVEDNRKQIEQLASEIESLPERSERRFHVFELSTAADSARWAMTLSTDSVDRDRIWVPAVLTDSRIQKLRIPSVPFYIVADSLGNQLIRTRSLDKAMSVVRQHI